MAKQSIYPPPVYVATFADGTTCRMSFWSQAGKPFNFERGRRLCAQAIGNERARLAAGDRYVVRFMPKLARWSEPTVVAPIGCMPAEDIIAGHVEYDGVTYLDPHFLPKPVPVIVQRTKRRAVAIDDALSVVAAYFGLADPNADELAGLRAAFAAKAAA